MRRSFRGAHILRSPVGGVALVVLCILAHWPGALSLPPVDRDESRFAQAMRQVAEAAEQGDWKNVLVPHIQDRPRLNKPPLVYWLAIPSSLALDHPDRDIGEGLWPLGHLPTGNIFAYRLVSLLSAMVAVLLTWRTGLALRFHPTAAWLGAALFATCIMVMWDARQARADQTLVACTTGAMLCLAHLWRGRHLPPARTRRWAIGLAIWIALGVLAKGIAILIVALAAASLALWTRGNTSCSARAWLRHLRAPWVVIASLLPIVAWFIATRFVLGTDQATSTAAKETIWRALIPQESHWGPPGYYLVLLPVLFFPGCLATASALGRAFSRATSGVAKNSLWSRIRTVLLGPVRARIDDRTIFCLAWIVLPWLMFELAMTKLPHYTLPMYPAIALLSARELLRMTARKQRPGFWGCAAYIALAFGVFVFAPTAIIWTTIYDHWLASDLSIAAAAPMLAPTMARTALTAALTMAIFLTLLVVVLTLQLIGRHIAIAIANAMATTAVVFAFMVVGQLTDHHEFWVSSRLVETLEMRAPERDRPLACVGYQEDSLIFLTRGRTQRIGAKRIESWFADNPDGVAFIREGSWDIDTDRFFVFDTVRGFNYSSGDWVTVFAIEALR